MPRGLIRGFAGALALFLFAQAFPLLAFGPSSADPASCCSHKDAYCCRRMHHALAGPAFSERPHCDGACQVWIRHSQPVPATVPQREARAGLAPALDAAATPSRRPIPALFDPARYQRPPPFAA